MQAFKDFLLESLSFRRTRSGSRFSDYYVVNKDGFDIDALLIDAQKRAELDQDQRDEPEPIGAYPGEEWAVDNGSDASSPLSSAPPSPLSSAPSSPAASRPPSPSPPERRAPTPTRPPRAKRPRLLKTKDVTRRRRPRFPSPPIHTPKAVTAPVIAENARKRAKKARSRLSRQKQRERFKESALPKLSKAAARYLADAGPIPTSVNLDNAPVTSTAFTAKRGDRDDEVYTLDDLVGPNPKVPGMSLVDWEGRKPKGIIVPDGRCFGVLAGQPDAKDWPAVHEGLAEEIHLWGDRVNFPKDSREHRRGNFRAEAHGWSHGGGQQEPGILSHSAAMTKILVYLVGLPAMIRIAHYASSVFAAWAPELWLYYASRMGALLKQRPDGAPNFARSVWACITINFGPRTVTFKHRDFGNLSFGWCAITALGKFDARRGGHLILWECGLVIPFPPGSTILIPSAIITHSNVSIMEGETRYSVTQYTSGAIFRWVDHGFQLDEEFFGALNNEQRADVEEMNAGRWEFGTHLWSKLDDLKARASERLARK